YLFYLLIISIYLFVSLLICRHPRSTLFPYTTLFRSSLRNIRRTRETMTKSIIYRITLFSRKCNFPTSDMVLRGSDMSDFPFQHRSEEHTSELQSHLNLVCRLLLEKKKKQKNNIMNIN